MIAFMLIPDSDKYYCLQLSLNYEVHNNSDVLWDRVWLVLSNIDSCAHSQRTAVGIREYTQIRQCMTERN